MKLVSSKNVRGTSNNFSVYGSARSDDRTYVLTAGFYSYMKRVDDVGCKF